MQFFSHPNVGSCATKSEFLGWALKGREDKMQQMHKNTQCVVDPFAKSEDGLCACHYGQPLDKTQQRSRWDLRPFSDAQLTYAALDAWILLALVGSIIHKASAAHASDSQ